MALWLYARVLIGLRDIGDEVMLGHIRNALDARFPTTMAHASLHIGFSFVVWID